MDSTTCLPSSMGGIPVRLPLLLRLGCRADADSLQGGGGVMDVRDLEIRIKADTSGKKDKKKQSGNQWEKAARMLERAPKKKKRGKK